MFRHLIAAAIALTTAHASASLLDTTGTATVRMTGFSQGHAVANVSMDDAGNIGVGQLKGTLDGTSFLTYCTDLFQSFQWNRDYTYTYAGTDTANGLTGSQADRLGKLYTIAGDVTNTQESVAFQLAVWELLYDTPPANVLTGNFQRISGGTSAQLALANDWLTDVMAPSTTSAFHAQRIHSSIAQDFVVFTAKPQPNRLISDVPEPAGIALVGLALAAMVAVHRRA
jgi:PEP-CTERM motif